MLSSKLPLVRMINSVLRECTLKRHGKRISNSSILPCVSFSRWYVTLRSDLIVGGIPGVFGMVGKSRLRSLCSTTEGLEVAVSNVESKLVEKSIEPGHSRNIRIAKSVVKQQLTYEKYI